MRRDRLLKKILTAWGLLCLFCAVLYVGLAVWAAGGTDRNFYPGNTGIPEWTGSLEDEGANVMYTNIQTAMPHRTLEERLTTFYGKPLDEIEPALEKEVDWGEAEGEEDW
ncbi:MAG: hypothetical protein IJT94_10185 [Oscillibacter sp.]|nr:hypothetical protein [Oscillibacter sp.]